MRDNTSFFKALESFKCNKKKTLLNKAKTHAQLKLKVKSWDTSDCWCIFDRNQYTVTLCRKEWLLVICKVRKLAELYVSYFENSFRKLRRVSGFKLEHGIEEAVEWADGFLNRCDEIEAKNKAGDLMPPDVDEDFDVPLL